MKKYIAEIIGTFAIVFYGTGAIIVNQETNGTITHIGISLVFGTIVGLMIYCFASISEAHFNPAVTIAFSFIKKTNYNQIFAYIFSQLIGAILASIILKFLFPSNLLLGSTIPSGSAFQSFILETILSFLLMIVILFTSQNTEKIKSKAGFLIGLTVMAEALFAGPISGASMNPARSIAPAIVSINISFIWIYILAPIAGMILATVVFNFFKNFFINQ